MKKALLYFTIIFTSIFATSVMIASTLSAPVNADEQKYDPSWGNAETAREKAFIDALYQCATKWTWKGRPGKSRKDNQWLNYIEIYPEDVKEGKWFEARVGLSIQVNPIVEEKENGHYEDGKIWCDENDNALVPAVFEAINAVHDGYDYIDLICDKTDSYITGGIVGRPNENDECGTIFDKEHDDNNYYYENSKSEDEIKEYLRKILGNGIFDPTGVEAYYMIRDAFLTVCVSGKASAGNNSPMYSIQEIGPDGGIIQVGYTGKSNPGPENYKILHIMPNGGDFGAPDNSTCRDLEEALNANKDIKKYSDYLKTNGLDPDNPGDDSDSEQAEQNCQNSGGAGALGWIVCSILDWMSNATEHLYDNVVEPELRVEPQLFDQGKGALTAWEYFRNFANIIFTILVLIVIFSQLTGVGIDNYGIKKILPKLIIAAIIVNLSYLICIICVDLSNIIGNGAQALFNNIPTTAATEESINVSIDGNSQNVNINTGADVGIIAVGTVSAAVGAIAIYANPALLLTLFVAVLGVLISVLFIFILLAGRKAAIVLLTVLSPVAFILYMLPNTKKIFDKWFGLWKAMLLVYPICGLLIGGGNFASRLMLSVGDHSSAATVFTAMVVGIVPIFFIPAAIKGAYAAIGSVGGAIAGFGNRLRGGATSRMRNSNAYKNAQKRGQDRNQRIRAMRRAGVRLDKDGNVVESRRPTAKLRRRVATSDNKFLNFVNRKTGLDASMGQGFSEFAQLETARRGNIAANDIDTMNAAFAGLADKESAQRVSNQETLMRAGKVEIDGKKLNVDNAAQMQNYHQRLLKSANDKKAAGDMTGYNSDMDKIRAAQNIMAKSDPGRGGMQQNYQEAVKQGYTGALPDAASHLMGAHGSDIKATNRAMHSLTQELAQSVSQTDMQNIQNKINSNAYDIDSISGYSAQSLASADDNALRGMRESVDAIRNMTDENGHNEKRDQLNTLIEETLSSKNIHSQPKVEAKLREIRDALNRPSSGPYGYDGAGI